MLSLEPKVAWAVMWDIINYPTKQLEHSCCFDQEATKIVRQE